MKLDIFDFGEIVGLLKVSTISTLFSFLNETSDLGGYYLFELDGVQRFIIENVYTNKIKGIEVLNYGL